MSYREPGTCLGNIEFKGWDLVLKGTKVESRPPSRNSVLAGNPVLLLFFVLAAGFLSLPEGRGVYPGKHNTGCLALGDGSLYLGSGYEP